MGQRLVVDLVLDEQLEQAREALVRQEHGDDGATDVEVTASRWPSQRIELDACLLPGKGDSVRLLLAWFVKKSFWWMFFGGAAFASLVHFVERVEKTTS